MNAQLTVAKCRLCAVCLSRDNPNDDFIRAICGDCRHHPAARRLGPVPTTPRPINAAARDFTAGEKALIRKVHGYMPPLQLLALLNERLQADLGDVANLYTIDQLHAEIKKAPGSGMEADDWSGLRKYLAEARRSGLLQTLTAQIVDDFTVVFALTSAQQLRLKDIVLDARETQGERNDAA